ncbi:MAG: ABC transporter permease [Candidatus Roizmanbacteria bacterium]|nr:ABC transporter permease [Candidatus Roizmanbacteria bacterium]
MNFQELFYESTLSLTVNKVRTMLAMLGVIIGIASVIAMLSLGQASQKSITNQIEGLGTNLLTIRPGSSQSGGIQGGFGSASTLTEDDAKILETSPLITTISDVASQVSQNAQLVAGKNNMNTSVYGVTETYALVNNVTIASGTFISERNQLSMSRVVVLGPNVITELFGEGANPVGQMIRIEGQSFTIIGITESKGGSGPFSQDDYVFIPLSTAMHVMFGLDSLSTISVAAKSSDVMEQTEEQITTVLLQQHKIKNPEDADFQISSQEDLLGTVTSVTGTFTLLLSGIAAISLVVGGIGIMNIMLVTVTERTREIGLRKALGAQKNTIIQQFLLETIMITFIGGIIGILIGMGISLILSSIMSLPFTIAVSSVFLAFGVSVGIGVGFGWYPAQKAANLQPIEALRYE